MKFPKIFFLLVSLSLTAYPLPLKASSIFDDAWQDLQTIGASPARALQLDPWYALPLAGVGGGLFTQDVFIAQQVRKEQNPTLDTLSQIGNTLGDGVFVLPAMGLLVAFGSPFDRQVGTSAILAFLEAGLVTHVVKSLTGRLRPSASPNDSNQWTGPNLGSYAFPSGHVTVAAAFSTVLAASYSWGWMMYAVPPLVAWARLYSDVHWASDVYFGFLVGWGVASIQWPRVQSSSPVRVSWRRPDQIETAFVIKF